MVRISLIITTDFNNAIEYYFLLAFYNVHSLNINIMHIAMYIKGQSS